MPSCTVVERAPRHDGATSRAAEAFSRIRAVFGLARTRPFRTPSVHSDDIR
jgi:hypothetical protein